MKSRSLVACVLTCLLLLLPRPAFASATPPDLRELVDGYAARRGFNGTVLVARGGRILFRGSYGEANVEWSVHSAFESRYRIGSLSKPLIATLVMQLVQQGRLTLDGSLGSYLPDLYAGTDAASATIAQLLSHTSGLADLPGRYDDPWWQTQARRSYSPLGFAREWVKPTMLEKPGVKWRYNNNGYFLLGVIVERVTGRSLADNLQQRIFRPAAMVASGLFSDTVVLSNFASGYVRTPEGELEHPQAIDPSVSFAAAGIYATVEDLYRFDRALYGTELLRQDTRETMLQRHSAAYGFGWGVEDWTLPNGSTLPVVSHTGSIPGYQSYYLRSEPNQDCVIVVSNFWQGALVVQMGKDLMEVLNGKPMTLPKRSLDDLLTPIAYRRGTNAMVAAYKALGRDADAYDLNESDLNALGYKFLRAGRKDAAIQVFNWTVERFPRSANAYDSLGEAYRAAGRLSDAVKNYSAALALNPASRSARQALDEMKSGTRPD